jgi:hypothetical protein
MKLREWILVNTAIDGDINNPKKIYTSIDASREVALRKMYSIIPPEHRWLVGLKKGKIVDK